MSSAMTSSALAGLPPEAMEELKSLLREKAADLFGMCDQEDKGFVTKRDMQRMRGEMSLDPDQLEAVFDRLDGDGNGFLTLEEFTDGFGEYLGIERAEMVTHNGGTAVLEEEGEARAAAAVVPDDDDDDFNLMLSELGILGLVDDDSALREMWLNLRSENDPALAANFEELLTQLARDLHRKTEEQERNLENAARSRAHAQEEHVKLLHEEMEAQIGAERTRIREEEERRERRMRAEVQSAMGSKDAQLADLAARLREAQAQLEKAKKAVPDMREENQTLARERDELQRELERQRLLRRDLEESVGSVSARAKQERRERAMAALRVSEGIALEREGLVRELDVVRAINAKMMDDRDVVVAMGTENGRNGNGGGDDLHKELLGRGKEEEEELLAPPVHSEFECDDDFYHAAAADDVNGKAAKPKVRRFHSHPSRQDSVSLHEELMAGGVSDSGRESGSGVAAEMVSSNTLPPLDDGEDSDSRPSSDGSSVPSRSRRRRPDGGRYSSSLLIFSVKDGGKFNHHQLNLPPQGIDSLSSGGDSEMLTSFGTRESSVNNLPAALGARTQSRRSSQHHHHHHHAHRVAAAAHQHVKPYEPVSPPQRVFKIIFIGDSTVGKSSLITRFCTGKFNAALRSTIGVDFHTRNLLVDAEQSVCLQCWDTAGQERYRAMTAQYFRKADAVVVVYDITSESSFLNAREWLDSAVEGAGGQASLLLLGNKVDLATRDDLLRKVRKTEGLNLSRQYSTLFGEVSALDGRSVEACMTELSRLLREREDSELQRALRLSLEGSEKKKKCCGGGKKE